MRYGATGCVIVHNGEIYNYLELRAELIENGYRFDTGTDTEVILAAYDRWGEECVQRFNGMWSFALFDPDREFVFCSRDRFGIKPFYYIDDAHVFAFGSEIRQVLPFLDAPRANRRVLLDFVCFGIDGHGTETFFSGVHRLAPGHNLMYRVDTGEYETRRYYRVPRMAGFREVSESDAVGAFRDLFVDSVRLRLRSDVPVGTCLSGGLDSSSIAAVAASLGRERGTDRFSAITAGSESPENDETGYARAVADRADLEWHRIMPRFDDFSATLREVVRALEEPFLSASMCMAIWRASVEDDDWVARSSSNFSSNCSRSCARLAETS